MNSYLYLILDIISFSVPFIVSFEKKYLNFIQFWKPYFTAIISVGLFFISWDIVFVIQNVWWFHPKYLVGISILHLPLEEWLFFILIPYSSNFIHYSLLYLFPKPKLGIKTSKIITWILFLGSLCVALFHTDRLYTLCSFGIFAILLGLQLYFNWSFIRRYYLSFIVIYIPFFIVNSWLTGSFTEEPIVNYNNEENLGLKIGTIPIEDTFYCFSLLYSSILLFEYLKSKNKNLSYGFNNT